MRYHDIYPYTKLPYLGKNYHEMRPDFSVIEGEIDDILVNAYGATKENVMFDKRGVTLLYDFSHDPWGELRTLRIGIWPPNITGAARDIFYRMYFALGVNFQYQSFACRTKDQLGRMCNRFRGGEEPSMLRALKEIMTFFSMRTYCLALGSATDVLFDPFSLTPVEWHIRNLLNALLESGREPENVLMEYHHQGVDTFHVYFKDNSPEVPDEHGRYRQALYPYVQIDAAYASVHTGSIINKATKEREKQLKAWVDRNIDSIRKAQNRGK